MWLNFFDWKLKTVYQLIGAVLSLVSDLLVVWWHGVGAVALSGSGARRTAM